MHSTPDPDVPPPSPEKDPPPDHQPTPEHAPIEEPEPPKPAVKT
jgi:protein TonB